MDLLEIFSSIKIEDIKKYVEESVEEDLFLEFKTVNHPTPRNDEFDKKNLSKCISGFANSLGGIIVWGINAKQNKKGVDAAKELKPIEELSKLSNWFKKIEGQAVTPSVLGVRHKKIQDGTERGFLITYVPPSEDCPHMANYADKHYYKRSGDSFYQCEHYDIVDMFNRRSTPKVDLRIDSIICQHTGSSAGKNHFKINAIIIIENKGKAIAKFPRLLLTVGKPYRLSDFGLDGNGGRGMKMFPTTRFSKGYYGGNEIVIHQDSEIQVDNIELKHIYDENAIQDLVVYFEVEAEGATRIKREIRIGREELISKFQHSKTLTG